MLLEDSGSAFIMFIGCHGAGATSPVAQIHVVLHSLPLDGSVLDCIMHGVHTFFSLSDAVADRGPVALDGVGGGPVEVHSGKTSGRILSASSHVSVLVTFEVTKLTRGLVGARTGRLGHQLSFVCISALVWHHFSRSIVLEAREKVLVSGVVFRIVGARSRNFIFESHFVFKFAESFFARAPSSCSSVFNR